MSAEWKTLTLILLFADPVVAVGLFFREFWGAVFFVLVAGLQIAAYSVFRTTFGPQTFMLLFHTLTLSAFFLLQLAESKLAQTAE